MSKISSVIPAKAGIQKLTNGWIPHQVRDDKRSSRQARTVTVAVLGSHSALDVCRGAKDEGLKTLVVVEKGRDKTYNQYFKSKGELGCVDEVLYVEKFKDIVSPAIVKKLNAKNCIFVPNRSFEVYVGNYDLIENDFKIPMFGNRKLLRLEERTEKPNQYDLLDKAGIRYPKIFKNPKDIDRLVIVKAPEKQRGFERSFFLASSPGMYESESKRLIQGQRIIKKDLNAAVIEEFVLGVQVNFNFFYSPINDRLELIGTDTRRQTDIEGILKLPATQQMELFKNPKIYAQYEEAGHVAVTTLESLLEPAFDIGEKFVKEAKEMMPPGVIGPFSLQAIITPGPPKKDIIVFDVSPRMPGSPGIAATPYGNYLWGKNLSMGRRVAIEIREAVAKNKLKLITT